MSLSVFLSVFGAVGGVIIAWIVIMLVVHVARKQVQREFRWYLSKTSPIYNPNDWF